MCCVGWWCWLWQKTTHKNEHIRSFSRVVDGGGCHVTSGEKDKKKIAGAPCARPCCRCHRRGGWWWHLQLQVLSSSPSSFVAACSYRWCRRHCPFAPAAQVWSPLSSVGTDMVVGGERRW